MLWVLGAALSFSDLCVWWNLAACYLALEAKRSIVPVKTLW